MALFGWENAVEADGVTLAVSTALSGFGPEMLRVPIGAPSVAWQTPVGDLSGSLTITSPTAIAWRAICLARTNLTAAATMRVRAGAYDSGIVPAGVAWGVGQALHILPSPVAASTVLIDIADPSNPDRCINIPLVYAGPCQDFRWAPGQSSTSVEARRSDVTTRGGIVLPTPLSRARAWQISIGLMRDDEIAWLDALEASAAAGRNILLVPRLPPYPRPAAETVLGLLTPGRRGFLSVSGQHRNWSATISERL